MNIDLHLFAELKTDSWFLWKNLEGAYKGCNDTFLQALSLNSRKDILDKSDFDFSFTKHQAQCFIAADQEVISSRITKTFQQSITLPDATIKILALKIPILNNSNEIEGVCCIVHPPLYNSSLDLNVLPPEVEKNNLTRREKEVFVSLATGKTAKEIGLQLNLSSRTVEMHIMNLKSKLNIFKKSELIELSLRHLLRHRFAGR